MSRSDRNKEGPSVTLHMVSSLDGFVAKKDNSVSWINSTGSVYEARVSVSEEDGATFIKTIDYYVLGSRTYEHALELGRPYGDTPAVVVLAAFPAGSYRRTTIASDSRRRPPISSARLTLDRHMDVP